MEELKPCPFCGGIAEKIRYSRTDGYMDDWTDRVICPKCGVHYDGKKAVELWNKRVDTLVTP